MLLIFDLDDTLYDRTGQVPDNYTDEDINRIVPFSGVREFLTVFTGKKVLVTTETVPGLQYRKIEVLQLRPYFDQIMLCHSPQEKKNCFQQAASLFSSQDVWVIGDRTDVDIKFGKECGFKTVWLRQGKYSRREPQDYWEIPDYEISSFSELSEIIT